jgi:hypothetical protein
LRGFFIGSQVFFDRVSGCFGSLMNSLGLNRMSPESYIPENQSISGELRTRAKLPGFGMVPGEYDQAVAPNPLGAQPLDLDGNLASQIAINAASLQIGYRETERQDIRWLVWLPMSIGCHHEHIVGHQFDRRVSAIPFMVIILEAYPQGPWTSLKDVFPGPDPCHPVPLEA